ncbi:hypothetical protein IQ06DRAFT_343884 [Phaeosphaeriaceae sp. SRC1lsM3a]|nr:hypothetical protein IQ06DRAFT_343884 [Stagonospora sp. SRC1lsM3a]
MSSSYLTVPRPRRQRTLSAFDYGSIEVHDDDKDGDYANAEDEDVTEDEDLENDTGTMKTNQFQRIERRCRRSPAPSPEGLPNVAATSTRKTGKKMEKKRQEVRPRAYQFNEPDGAGRRRWYVGVEGHDIQDEEFSISEEQLGVKWALLLDEYRKMSRKDRRVNYNNVFENYWRKHKKQKRSKKK